ncbi:MAG: histidine phosphatase family protein [Actinomycetes bacterium]
MTTTTVFLVRHGETVWHAEHRYAGRSNVTLTSTGYRQARELAAWAAVAGLDAVWSSDLRRARETAEASAAATGHRVHVDARLRELDFGDGEGLTHAEMAARWPEAFAAFQSDPVAHHLPGGEEPRAGVARSWAAVREAAAAHPGGNVLLVGHGTLMRLLLCDLLGATLAAYRSGLPEVRSTAVTEVRVSDETASLLSYNCPVPRPPAT